VVVELQKSACTCTQIGRCNQWQAKSCLHSDHSMSVVLAGYACFNHTAVSAIQLRKLVEAALHHHNILGDTQLLQALPQCCC